MDNVLADLNCNHETEAYMKLALTMELSDAEMDEPDEEQLEIQFVEEQDRRTDSDVEPSGPTARLSDHAKDLKIESTPRMDSALNAELIQKHGYAVVVPPIQRPWEYMTFKEPAVIQVLDEYDDPDEVVFQVRFADGREDDVSLVFIDILSTPTSYHSLFIPPL